MSVVLALDIGTTSTKAVAYRADGTVAAEQQASYPLNEPRPGWAEQDPEQVVAAVFAAAAAACRQLADTTVRAVSFSSAMHSLVGLDRDGKPLTPLLTWADLRSAEQAERLRASLAGPGLHQRTGTPLHPMSPLPKLVWFAENAPQLCRQVAHWAGVKELVLLRLCGRLVMDHSVASGTGLMDLTSLDWDEEALGLAGVSRDRLPELVPARTVLPGLTAAAAGTTGLPQTVPVVVGAGDGPLANLGLGAVRPGSAACSIGTSAALRVMSDRPAVDPQGRVFCYALVPGLWAVGGALNNGGIVLDWVHRALAPDLGSAADLMAVAATSPAGSGGLLMLPYLQSERAPHWSAIPRGAYVGLTSEHGRAHLVRAALEGVCHQLAVVLSAMRAAGTAVTEVRATGGFTRSPLWRQLLADCLDLPIGFPAGAQGSAYGAALLAADALGEGDLTDAAERIPLGDVLRPQPEQAAVYAAARPVFAGLYDWLLPAFAALRQLGGDAAHPV